MSELWDDWRVTYDLTPEQQRAINDIDEVAARITKHYQRSLIERLAPLVQAKAKILATAPALAVITREQAAAMRDAIHEAGRPKKS